MIGFKECNSEKFLKDAKIKLYQYNLRGAIDLTEKAIDGDETLTEAYRFLAHLNFYFEKEQEKAHELIDKAIEINTEEYESYKIKGDIFYDEKKFNLAVESYKKALEIKALADSELLSRIGDCYFCMDNKKDSETYYERAIDEDPLCINAISKMRVMCVEKDEYLKAFDLWKMYNLIDEKDVDGTIELNVKNIKQALDKIENNPKDFSSLVQLGDSYHEAALYDDAGIVYKKALKIDSSQSDIDKKARIIEDYLNILKEFKETSVEIYNTVIHGGKRDLKKHKQVLYSILLKLDIHYEELKKFPRKITKKFWKRSIWNIYFLCNK